MCIFFILCIISIHIYSSTESKELLIFRCSKHGMCLIRIASCAQAVPIDSPGFRVAVSLHLLKLPTLRVWPSRSVWKCHAGSLPVMACTGMRAAGRRKPFLSWTGSVFRGWIAAEDVIFMEGTHAGGEWLQGGGMPQGRPVLRRRKAFQWMAAHCNLTKKDFKRFTNN